MQDKVVKTDQLYQNSHILSYMTPNELKLVQIFSILIKEQFLWRNLCLEMPPWSSKLACKNSYEIRTLNSFLKFSSLTPYHLIIMHSHAILALIHILTHHIMHKYHLNNNIKLRRTLTNPWNLAKLIKSEFSSQNQAFLAYLSSFFFLLFLVFLLIFYSLFVFSLGSCEGWKSVLKRARRLSRLVLSFDQKMWWQSLTNGPIIISHQILVLLS